MLVRLESDARHVHQRRAVERGKRRPRKRLGQLRRGTAFAFETAHDAASGLDPAARTAVRRIASTLARHERDGVDVRGMTNAERCGKMLKRKITSKAAALVEGAAAAAAVEDARTYLRGNDPHMMPENHRKRPVVTAGDAILTWVVSAAAAKKRERVELDARNAELQERVLTLLSEVDAMADAVPSRRIAAGVEGPAPHASAGVRLAFQGAGDGSRRGAPQVRSTVFSPTAQFQNLIGFTFN